MSNTLSAPLPCLSMTVGMSGTSRLLETTGPVCAAVGVAVGILVNVKIHPR
jgi:hypothetical protein